MREQDHTRTATEGRPVSSLKTRLLRSSEELVDCREAWDDLWERSDVANPTSQAELVAARVRHLEGSAQFRALIVESADRIIAALPLISRRLKGLLRVGSLPCNCWIAGGSLLLDPTVDAIAALDSLATGIHELPWPILWLDQVSYEHPHWKSLRGAAERSGISGSVREHYRIGQVEIGHDWEAYKRQMKGDHRRKLNRYVRKLDEAGGAELRLIRPQAPEKVDSLVQRAFEIEDRSWKGTEGTSVLNNPSVLAHYRQESRELARRGQLELAFLEHHGRSIAFVYGYSAKGVFFVTKLGYDEEFMKFGPGQQLILRLLEQFHGEPERRLVDFAGPLVPFHQVWATSSYPVGPLVLATSQLLARGMFHVYTQWQPRIKRVRERVAFSLQTVRTTVQSIKARLWKGWQPETPVPRTASPALGQLDE